MYLLLDLSEKNINKLALFDEKTIEFFECESLNNDLLVCIKNFLDKKSLDKKSVQGVMVVVGTGGFTSTRLATTVANSFAHVLDIPVLAISATQVYEVQKLISKLEKQPKGQYISAKYSGEPNIR